MRDRVRCVSLRFFGLTQAQEDLITALAHLRARWTPHRFRSRQSERTCEGFPPPQTDLTFVLATSLKENSRRDS